MEENGNLKSRKDFETESDWWTYRVIHDEEFSALENEDSEEEKEYPYLILQCQNCGEIIDENITKPNMTLPYEKRVKCKCGKFKFKAISAKKKKELENKKDDVFSEYKIKKTVRRIEIDLEKVKDELNESLNSGEISAERYVVLMIELIGREYDYYRRDVGKRFNWKDFRNVALDSAKLQLEKKYECDICDEKLDRISSEYQEEKDIIFLEKYQILLNGSLEIEEDPQKIEEIERKIESLENKTKILLEEQERQNANKKSVEEKYYDKQQYVVMDTFKDELKKSLKK